MLYHIDYRNSITYKHFRYRMKDFLFNGEPRFWKFNQVLLPDLIILVAFVFLVVLLVAPLVSGLSFGVLVVIPFFVAFVSFYFLFLIYKHGRIDVYIDKQWNSMLDYGLHWIETLSFSAEGITLMGSGSIHIPWHGVTKVVKRGDTVAIFLRQKGVITGDKRLFRRDLLLVGHDDVDNLNEFYRFCREYLHLLGGG